MATIAISPSDVADATNFLEQFLTDENPNGDFSAGTALRDLTIGALAAVFAYLLEQNNLVRARQSLKTIQAGVVDADPASLQDAVTALLSNFFVNPKAGLFSRGTGVAHSSQQVDIFIQPTHRFTRAPGLVFRADIDATLLIPAGDLLPIIDAGGNILEYQFRIPMVALAVGDAFNVDPGLFSDFDKFSPFVTRIEVITKFGGGRGPETTQEILTRAPTAISVRNLINERSIQAVLEETFPDIKALLVIGMGDPEMQRDRLAVSGALAVHVGGAADIYLLLSLVETSFTGVVGDLYERPDGIANILRDTDGTNFAPVQTGDIVRIVAGIPGVPREFFVVERAGNQIFVSERIPFPIATDEQSPAVNAQYTVGRIPPAFNDVLSNGGLPLPHGVTTRQTVTDGRVTLPGGPVMDILDVAIIDPSAPEAAYKSAIDGFIHFTDHVNHEPDFNVDPTIPLQYQVIVHNPLEAQSARQWMEIVVGQAGGHAARYDGLHLRVRYLTLSNYQSIYDYVVDRSRRTNCANQLPRGQFPVTLGMTISYRLKPTATAVLNNAVLAQTVVDFVNSFDTTVSPIDVSSIMQKLKDTYPDIAAVFPFEIDYSLFAPTGDVVKYSTLDEVRLTADKKLFGEEDLDFLALSLSARTVRYLTAISAVVLVDLGAPTI